MDGVGHQFLSGAALPADQYGGVAAGHLADHLEHFTHLVAVADNVVDAVLVFQFVPQALVFRPQRLFFQMDGLQVDGMAGQHGGHHGKQFGAFLQRVVRIKGPVHAQGAHHPLAFLHREHR
jgi:hypothetical protein